MQACIDRLNEYLVGWIGYFRICTGGVDKTLETIDAHIRRRLRAIQVKHWKRRRTMAQKLTKLGVAPKLAWRAVYWGRQSTWSLSRNQAMHRGLRNAYFAERGLVSLAERWEALLQRFVAPAQLTLPLG